MKQYKKYLTQSFVIVVISGNIKKVIESTKMDVLQNTVLNVIWRNKEDDLIIIRECQFINNYKLTRVIK